MGKNDEANQDFINNINIWYDENLKGNLDAILSNTSGCGTTMKDYAFIFRDDKKMKKKAKKVYGVKYKNEIHAVMCFAFTNQIPKSVYELDLFSRDAFLQSATRDQNVGQIAIAYTVWSNKKGGGKLIVKEVFKMIKKSNHLNRLVTLSPLTEMARNFHLKNGAEEIRVNEETQNFEYKIIK